MMDCPLLTRLAIRINAALETVFPEQRLYLKSEHGTHYLRLRPVTQGLVVLVGAMGLAWTIVATALFMMHSLSAGSVRDQSQRQGMMFEERLTLLSTDRDLRASEALQAQERFNMALTQVSSMQEMLLASEDRRRELETGIDVVQNTLRGVIRERDSARDEVSRLNTALSQQGGNATEIGRAKDTVASLDFLSTKLAATAAERDQRGEEALAARDELILAQDERRALELRHDAIFARLEEAVTVSVEPLERMFRSAGLNPNDLIATVRRGYSGQGGPLAPITASSMGGGALSASEKRANAILKQMEEMDLYRLAAWKAPFANPIPGGGVRLTSGFGGRNDPFGKGHRQHEGQDYAGSYGTPIHATAEGVVVHAGWQNGYGRLIKIRHAFGIETRYAHLSQIRVKVGQKVSRGERIGDMGNSGRSTGTHLHYEVRIGGSAVNPMTFIKAARDVF